MADREHRPDPHPEAGSGGRRSEVGTSYGDWVPDEAQSQVVPPPRAADAAEPGAGWGRELDGADGGTEPPRPVNPSSADPTTGDTPSLDAAAEAHEAARAAGGAFGLGGGRQDRGDGGGAVGSTGSGYGYAGTADPGPGERWSGAFGTATGGGAGVPMSAAAPDGTTGGPEGARDGPPGASAPDLSGDAFGAEDPGSEGLVAGATPTGGGVADAVPGGPRVSMPPDGGPGDERAPSGGPGAEPRSRGSGLAGPSAGGDRYQRFVDDFARWRRVAAASGTARQGAGGRGGSASPGASGGSGSISAHAATSGRSLSPGRDDPSITSAGPSSAAGDANDPAELADRASVPGLTTPEAGGSPDPRHSMP